MRRDESLDVAIGDIQPILEDTVQQKTLTVALCLTALKIDQHGIYAANLLESLRLIVADRSNEYEQIGVVIGDLGEQLDEVKRPSLNLGLWTITQSIKPRLEFVEEQYGGLRFKHLKEQVTARHIGFGIAFAKPFSLDKLALRM